MLERLKELQEKEQNLQMREANYMDTLQAYIRMQWHNKVLRTVSNLQIKSVGYRAS